jgi:hypothetical protein
LEHDKAPGLVDQVEIDQGPLQVIDHGQHPIEPGIVGRGGDHLHLLADERDEQQHKKRNDTGQNDKRNEDGQPAGQAEIFVARLAQVVGGGL